MLPHLLFYYDLLSLNSLFPDCSLQKKPLESRRWAVKKKFLHSLILLLIRGDDWKAYTQENYTHEKVGQVRLPRGTDQWERSLKTIKKLK